LTLRSAGSQAKATRSLQFIRPIGSRRQEKSWFDSTSNIRRKEETKFDHRQKAKSKEDTFSVQAGTDSTEEQFMRTILFWKDLVKRARQRRERLIVVLLGESRCYNNRRTKTEDALLSTVKGEGDIALRIASAKQQQ
jgi:competence transcription factor ComK